MLDFQILFFVSVTIFHMAFTFPQNHRSVQTMQRNNLDPEAYMTTEEMISYHGYPVEVYRVITSDGYILTIQRIPYGQSGPTEKSRKPVLVQHGLLCSAASWVSNTKDKNLPYVLADAGYDVWLGNVRGTLFGRNHSHFNPEKSEFWEYSFDEMAKYDVPAVIDTMLKVTGYKQILYIGHSMGTTMGFAMLATQPKYNNIVRTMFALAPVAYLSHVRSPLSKLAPFSKETSFLLNLFGTGEIMENTKLTKFLSATVCNSPVRILCSSILFLLCGFNLDQLNQTRLPVFLHHTPAATSVQNLIHFAQMVDSGKFQYQDFGTKKNVAVYGQRNVPVYDISKISAPVVIFWSDNDYLADPKDVAKLAQNLPNLAFKYRVPMEKFSHLDFMWAIDVNDLVYDKLITLMKKSWRD